MVLLTLQCTSFQARLALAELNGVYNSTKEALGGFGRRYEYFCTADNLSSRIEPSNLLVFLVIPLRRFLDLSPRPQWSIVRLVFRRMIRAMYSANATWRTVDRQVAQTWLNRVVRW